MVDGLSELSDDQKRHKKSGYPITGYPLFLLLVAFAYFTNEVKSALVAYFANSKSIAASLA
ncbi:MAG: hypothetical protein RR382_11790, partial [Tannerellaceae bacterium]